MNVSTLKPFDFAQAVARAGLTTQGQPIAKAKAAEVPGFQQALTQALGSVSRSQEEATRLQREVQLDNPTVSLEETMVAMQKSQIGFQATLQVRNRLEPGRLGGLGLGDGLALRRESRTGHGLCEIEGLQGADVHRRGLRASSHSQATKRGGGGCGEIVVIARRGVAAN